MLYYLIHNKLKLIRSMLAAGIVQDKKLEEMKEAKRRRLEVTSTVTSTVTFTAQARKSSVS